MLPPARFSLSPMPETAKPPSDPGLVPTQPADEVLERLREATRGEYDIYGELGRGGMATVYLAHEISLDRKVAIKVMAPAMLTSSGLVERFKREARTAASLSHPNIIPIYSVREVNDLLFCVIKLVQGTALDAIMRELGQVPIPMAQAILAQVGDALAYAHRHGVVHRDVKPANILIDDDGWAVVTDFGIAKVADVEGLTLTGVAVGTPTYMSPEQCVGDEVSGASDQYSLGVVAYEMLTGRPPFKGASMMSVMYSHFHDTPTPIEELRPDCPEEMRNAVMRMLSKMPADRWVSLEEAALAMGARPLARDDPTRSQLITLARSGASHRIVSQMRTPQSPIPRSFKPNAKSDASPKARSRPFMLAAGAAILLGAGYVIAQFGPSNAAPEGPAVVTEAGAGAAKDTARVDSAPPPTAQRSLLDPLPPPPSASVREQNRVSAPPRRPAATAPSKPSADSLASKLVSSQAAPNAAAPSSLGVNRTAKADSVAQLPTSPNVRTVPLPEPSRQPAVVSAVDEQAEVRTLILAFARALSASDLAAARRLYPGMPNEQRQGFEALWREGTLTPRWTVSDIVVDGGVATARVQGTNVVSRRGTVSELPVSLRARLEKRGGEWRLVALVN